MGEKLRFSTEIAVCLGNGTRQAHGCYKTLIGSQRRRIDPCHYITLNLHYIFRLDALAKALSVIATATWLGGWVAGWLGVCHTPVLYQNG